MPLILLTLLYAVLIIVLVAGGTSKMHARGTRDVPGSMRFRYGLVRTVMAVLVLSCQACAFSYTDSNGDRHTIGLVDITVHPPAAPETFAGDVVEVTAVGLVMSKTAQGGHIALGYSHEATAALRDNVFVIGNPARPLAASDQAPKGLP